MASRNIIVLVIILAIVQALAPDAIPGGLVPLALVILGLLYAIVAVDAEDSTAYLVVAIAVGAAAGADVLSNIPGILGESLDAIVDPIATALYAGVIAILVQRGVNRIKS
ncbi:MAG: hypothetical protein OXG87_10280 [Gemmatimonadetes bacterium]|nr:hypothetical protein [Gemmatimonadota bacterium]